MFKFTIGEPVITRNAYKLSAHIGGETITAIYEDFDNEELFRDLKCLQIWEQNFSTPSIHYLKQLLKQNTQFTNDEILQFINYWTVEYFSNPIDHKYFTKDDIKVTWFNNDGMEYFVKVEEE